MTIDHFYNDVYLYNIEIINIIQKFMSCIDGKGFTVHFSSKNLIVKTEFISGELKAVISFYREWVEFWQFPAAYPSDEWRKLSHEYLMQVGKLVPGSTISFHKRDIDLKIKKKYMPIEALRPHVTDIANLFLASVNLGRQLLAPSNQTSIRM